MTWTELIAELGSGKVVVLTPADGNNWFQRESISSLNELQRKLESQIPGLKADRTPDERLLVRYVDMAKKLHPDCIENPAIRGVPSDSDRPYFKALLKFEREDVRLVAMPGSEPNKCHCNVRSWVDSNAGYDVVPGWLLRPDDLSCIFVCHSVTERPGEKPIDVTPYFGDELARRQRMEFVRHPSSPEEFRILRDKYNEYVLTAL